MGLTVGLQRVTITIQRLKHQVREARSPAGGENLSASRHVLVPFVLREIAADHLAGPLDLPFRVEGNL